MRTTGTATVTNSILYGNVAGRATEPDISGTATVTYSDIAGDVYAGVGNVNGDPLFVTPDPASVAAAKTTGNYHIQSGSAAIDTGVADDNTPDDDIDGDSRPQGSGIDMGSDEL